MGKAQFHCGRLYSGKGSEVLEQRTVLSEDGRITAIVPRAEAPNDPDAEVHDLSSSFVIPGLIDVHTHLAYGNAKSEEDIDLYGSLEFRALRGTFFAHQVLAAGYTSICAPGDSGMVSRAIRDAIDAGLFEGPNVTAAGPYLTSRQGLTDWFPTWIGVPTTSIGVLIQNRDEAMETIRRQVKEGVDIVKIAMDGIQRRPDGELIAAFTQDETTAMVDEVHRLGRLVYVHARGREATLYAARAGVDVIFHASYMDDECLEAVLRNGCSISPTLTLLRNTMDFLQPADPWAKKERDKGMRSEFDVATEALSKARAAGVPMPTGTDSGFAITPFGEWHARELEIYVEHLGFSPLAAIEASTSVSARVARPKDKVGQLAPGFHADLVAVSGDPSKDISLLLDQRKLTVFKDGLPVTPPRRHYDPRKVSDFAMTMVNDLYTQQRVAELRGANDLIRTY